MSTMHPERRFMVRTQRGVAIVTAIFLLMLMAAIGALMVTITTAGSATSVQDMQGVRAYQAARAGLEWGLYRALMLPPGTCAGTPPTLAGDLAPFSVTVTCTSNSYTEGVTTFTITQITSTATLGTNVGSANYVERQLQASVER